MPAWLAGLAIASLTLGFGSAVAIGIDLFRHPQRMAIMNAVWPITALYFGPIAVWWYWTLGRAMQPGSPASRREHQQKRPFWKMIIVEATHCGAGCALGDVIAEFTIYFSRFSIRGSGLLTDYAGDFVLAYAFGIVFQYFAIAPMRGLSLFPGLWAAIQADTFSLIAFEVGLFAWMAVMAHLPFQLTPVQPAYWFLMQIGMVIGFATSYPANWFLVRRGIKEPM